MRRSDRGIKDFTEITDVLRRADTIRLCMNDTPYPYAVPLSFGFEVMDGVITIYFHGAAEGMKHELLAKDNNVCVEADIFHGYARTEKSVTTEYESVIGFGAAEIVTGDEAVDGMELILEHCGFAGYEYDKNVLKTMKIYKITLASVTGKRRFV